jgi:hypothetical protein
VRGQAGLDKSVDSPPPRMTFPPQALRCLISWRLVRYTMDLGHTLRITRSRQTQAPQMPESIRAWAFVENLKRYASEAVIGKFHLRRTRHTLARSEGEELAPQGQGRASLHGLPTSRTTHRFNHPV